MNEDDRHNGSDGPQQGEGRKLPERDDLELFVEYEGRVVAEVHAADQRADHARDHDRRESRERVVTDHHLQGEEDPGDRRVERSRDGGRHTAAEQRTGQPPAEMKAQGKPRPQDRPQMDDRPFPTDGGATTDRRGRRGRGPQACAERHASAIERRGLHDVGHTLGLAVREKTVDEKTDQKAAETGDKQQQPPVQPLGMTGQSLAGIPETQPLHGIDGVAKADGGASAGGADQHCHNRQHDLVAPAKPAKRRQHAAAV